MSLCPHGCGSPVVEVSLQVTPDDLVMCSCSTCDERIWFRNGKILGLDAVLDMVADSELSRA